MIESPNSNHTPQPEPQPEPQTGPRPEPPTAMAQEPGPRPEMGLVDIVYGIIAQPNDTLKALRETPRPGVGIAAYLVVSLVTSAAGSSAIRRVGQLGGSSFGFVLVLSVLGAFLAWFAMTGTVHLVAELLGGAGSGRGLVCLLGVAAIPGAGILPTRLVLAALGLSQLNLAASFVIGVWVLVLQVLATKHNYRFSTGQAIVALLAPVFAVIIAVIGVGAIIGVLVLNSPLLRDGLPRIPGLP